MKVLKIIIATLWLTILTTVNGQVLDTETGPGLSGNDSVPTGPSFADQRLIELFIENARQGNSEWAFAIYEKISYKDVLELQGAYMRLLERTGKTEGIRARYTELMKQFPDHLPFREGALFHEARERHEAAEKRYQEEMAKYERNKNTTTHALLMRELRIISAEFRKIQSIANELHKINPSDRRYLMLMRNIHLRLNENEEAARIARLLEQN